MIFHRLLAAIAAINLLDLLITLVAFIVLIGIMVVVHEFGHFAVAKLCKVRVEAFSFGFGPRLFGYKYGDTDYKVCALPLGGYVKMSGEQFAELSDAAAGTATIAPVSDPGALTSHPRWQQMLIGVAGPVANFILAFVLMAVYYNFINEVPAVEIKDTAVEWVIPGSPAAQAGIQPGDIIRRFADASNPSWQTVLEQFALNSNQTVPFTVERAGKTLQLSFHVPGEMKDDGIGGMLTQYTAGPIGVVSVQEGTPAAEAGLRAGDGIQSVDGLPFHSVTSLRAYMEDGKGKAISLVVVRNGVALPPVLAHPAQIGSDWLLGFKPLPPLTRRDPLPLKISVQKSNHFFMDNSTLLLKVLKRIATRKIAASSALGGPLSIARAAGDAAESKSLEYMFTLGAQISISLGIINLMPFPILDGGMILFLLIESTLRREINLAVKERIYQVAFFMIIGLFAFLIFNDFAKLPFVERLLKP
ncbi:MAG: RIP metalloprotease RseP [Terracidiphilus sp.]